MLTLVQARMSSSRLPGKTLSRIGGRPVLDWVLHRLVLAGISDPVVITSDDSADDVIEQHCGDVAVACSRGSLTDLLDRSYWAARHQLRFHRRVDTVIRITADCPLLDPWLLREMADLYRADRLDYATVTGCPEGLHQEMFSYDLLERAWLYASSPDEREHVVPWMLNQLIRRGAVQWDGPNQGRYTLDTQDDLRRLRRLYTLSRGRLFDMPAAEIIQLDQHATAAA